MRGRGTLGAQLTSSENSVTCQSSTSFSAPPTVSAVVCRAAVMASDNSPSARRTRSTTATACSAPPFEFHLQARATLAR